MLLIIPGIFWAIRYFFAPIHTALSDTKPYVEQTLRFSKQSTIGRWWDVAGRIVLPQAFFNIILAILAFGFAAIVSGGQQVEVLANNFFFNLLMIVMNGLFLPLMVMPVVLLYRDLVAHHNKTA